MSLIIPPGFGSASWHFTGAPGTPEFVTTCGVDLSDLGGDFILGANGLFQHYADTVGTVTLSTLTLDHVSILVGSDGPSGSVDSSLPPEPMTGPSTNPAPVAMSAIARKVTNDLGRRGRGRMFLPGSVYEPLVNESGILAQTLIDDLDAALISLHDLMTGATPSAIPPMPPVLLHASAPADPTPVSAFAIQPLVGWIRGRIR